MDRKTSCHFAKVKKKEKKKKNTFFLHFDMC